MSKYKTPRGICPVCARDVAMRGVDGRLGIHEDKKTTKTCKGWGLMPRMVTHA